MSEIKKVKIRGRDGQIRWIPMDELAPGMIRVIEVSEDGHKEEELWVPGNSILPISKVKRESLPDEFRADLRKLREDVIEVFPQSIEQWEDVFKKEPNHEKELKIWKAMAGFYIDWITEHSINLLGKRREVFQVILNCTMHPPESILKVVKREYMSKMETIRLIKAYCDKYSKGYD